MKGMGEIKSNVRFANYLDICLHKRGDIPEKDIRSAEVEAVVDTGAVMMLLPQDLVEALGLDRMGKTIATLADESRVELEQAGMVSVTIAGRTWNTDCLVGPPGCQPLIGQLVLERLDLVADPGRRAVTVRPESPWLPTLTLKETRQELEAGEGCPGGVSLKGQAAPST